MSAGQAKNKKIRAHSLAKGLDPPLICMTEVLLASAVSCRMISMGVEILPNRLPCANNVHIILNGNIGQIATPGPI